MRRLAILCILALALAASRELRPKPKPKDSAEPIARVNPRDDRATWEKDGLRLEVSEDRKYKTYLKGYVHYRATAINKSKGDRTLSAKLLLHPKPRRRRGRGGALVECLLYLEIPAGESRTVRASCQIKEDVGFWQLLILKDWSFVP